jgi:hypothetical protein
MYFGLVIFTHPNCRRANGVVGVRGVVGVEGDGGSTVSVQLMSIPSTDGSRLDVLRIQELGLLAFCVVDVFTSNGSFVLIREGEEAQI